LADLFERDEYFTTLGNDPVAIQNFIADKISV